MKGALRLLRPGKRCCALVLASAPSTGKVQLANESGILRMSLVYACRLPVRYKTNLCKFFILHCDLTTRASMTVVCPFFSRGFWRRCSFLHRVEFLEDHIAKARSRAHPARRVPPRVPRSHACTLARGPGQAAVLWQPDGGSRIAAWQDTWLCAGRGPRMSLPFAPW